MHDPKPAPDSPPGAGPQPPADQPAPAAPSPPEESPGAGTCEDMCAGLHELASVVRQSNTGEAMTVDWFKDRRPVHPVTVRVEFDIDELAEAVMERIAERMVGK